MEHELWGLEQSCSRSWAIKDRRSQTYRDLKVAVDLIETVEAKYHRLSIGASYADGVTPISLVINWG